MDSLKRILVAVDFSACSSAALRQASRIAAWNRATLAALHVVPDPVYPLPPDLYFPLDATTTKALLQEARDRWATWSRENQGGASARFDAIIGIPRYEILQRVERDKPDLLVVGAHSELDTRRGIGSTASACVQRAGTRVLVVREDQVAPFRSVVACVDFTDLSREALDQAIRVAAQDDSALHILHVFEDPWRGLRLPDKVRNNLPDLAERYRGSVERHLRSFCEPQEHETGALRATFHAVQADSHGKGIVDFVRHQHCDLAVLGTRSKWNLRDLFWGPTAERVVREASCSVLTIKPAQRRQRKSKARTKTAARPKAKAKTRRTVRTRAGSKAKARKR